jgi:hypothetical protein
MLNGAETPFLPIFVFGVNNGIKIPVTIILNRRYIINLYTHALYADWSYVKI